MRQAVMPLAWMVSLAMAQNIGFQARQASEVHVNGVSTVTPGGRQPTTVDLASQTIPPLSLLTRPGPVVLPTTISLSRQTVTTTTITLTHSSAVPSVGVGNSPASSTSGNSKGAIALGTVVGIVSIGIALAALFFMRRLRNNRRNGTLPSARIWRSSGKDGEWYNLEEGRARDGSGCALYESSPAKFKRSLPTTPGPAHPSDVKEPYHPYSPFSDIAFTPPANVIVHEARNPIPIPTLPVDPFLSEFEKAPTPD